MGCSQSNQQGAQDKSKRIDRDISKDQAAINKTIKLLMLGAGESGKSTIIKQMRIIHANGYTNEECEKYKTVIYTNATSSIITIIRSMSSLNIQFQNKDNNDYAQNFLRVAGLMAEGTLSKELTIYIKQLWADPAVQECYSRAREFQLNDSAKYFLDDIERICADNYVPTQQDVLHSRVKTTGIIETEFKCRDYIFKMYDVGGQRSERKKWIHCFEDVTAVIFCASLAGYDSVLAEDDEMNRMHESMVLFDSICNNKWFAKTSLVLFLNKTDIFRSKIQHVPLTVCFPEYEGKNTYDDATKYIKQQYESLNKDESSREIYSHFTCATDTGNIERIFDSVSDVIIKNYLNYCGLL